MLYFFSALIGYLFGCINTAYIVAKIKGINIKNVGTNNAGASNVFISVGKIYGVFAGIGDILKSFLAALFVSLFFNNFEAAVIAGAMAVIGHIFPFWMKFNGGKGLASFMGLILFYDWKLFLIFIVLIAAILLITDYIAIGSLFAPSFMMFYSLFVGKNDIVSACFIFLAMIMWFKHKENIIRIKNGTEIGFRRKNKYKK